MTQEKKTPDSQEMATDPAGPSPSEPPPARPLFREIGGRTAGPEPTRYGDWEKDGKCVDF
ncbi:MAG: DUF1674 domain-containing protein [Alphaproteobacteria bacterium]|nr:DUF1674 domain-containing protein [Alphaproteobacteria bacterium]